MTFGWTETIDIDIVVKWLYSHPKVSNVILWGRSMGGATSIFYMSPDFRDKIYNWLLKVKNVAGFRFQDLDRIKAIILDSPFAALEDSMKHFATKKMSNMPEWTINSVIFFLNKIISGKTNVKLSDLAPKKYIET